MEISELTKKQNAYEVTDPNKQVSADEYNTILETVQEHDSTLPNTVQTAPQTFTEAQQEQARENIGALASEDVPDAEIMNLLAYGVEWDTEVANPAMTRVGNMSMHRDLPIQSLMRGCLLDDSGMVVEYLTPSTWTANTRDGSKGQVMVELPEHYRKFVTDGTKRQAWISTYPISGFHKVPKMYISAYEATVQRSTLKLSSVVNTSADYRGGNNDTQWDGTYRTLEGKPATNINRTNFRTYARNRKPSTAEWNMLDYNAYKAVFWLYYIEYANRNSQLAFTSEKTAEGFAQGGLGNGVTNLSDAEWTMLGNTACVPCGVTDTLGNGSGEVAYDLLYEDGSVLKTVYANRYRGIENPFGHIWKWADGINISISPTEENGVDNTSKAFVADKPANYNDNNYDGYTMRGLEARVYGNVRELVFGEFGDIMPAGVGGSATMYWADQHYTNIREAEVLCGVQFGSNASSGAYAGFACATSRGIPSYTNENLGTRLCFIPNADKELKLTVKDNGNIVLSNIDGQTKEFMPATPSGDPMHYAYENLGFEYNADTGLWRFISNMPLLAHETFTTEEMRDSYNRSPSFVEEGLTFGDLQINPLRIAVLKASKGTADCLVNTKYFGSRSNVEYVIPNNRMSSTLWTNSLEGAFAGVDFQCPIKGIYFYFVLPRGTAIITELAFYRCPDLAFLMIFQLASNLNLGYSPKLIKFCVQYIIANRSNAVGSPITLTLHETVYNKIMSEGGEWADLAALLPENGTQGQMILESYTPTT